MILSSKLIPHIVKGIRSGKEALLDNRRVPSKLMRITLRAFLKNCSRQLRLRMKNAC